MNGGVRTCRRSYSESAECLKWVKLRRIGLAAPPPVNLQQRKCGRIGRHSRLVPKADIRSCEARDRGRCRSRDPKGRGKAKKIRHDDRESTMISVQVVCPSYREWVGVAAAMMVRAASIDRWRCATAAIARPLSHRMTPPARG